MTQHRFLRAAVMALCVAASSAGAAVIQVNSLSADTVLDWSSLGGDQTDLGASASLGLASVSGAPAFALFETGTTFNGDFLPGQIVLSHFDLLGGNPSSGAFDIVFSSAIQGFGTQLQAGAFGSFNGLLEVFNSANSLLASFNLAGSNNGNGDGSALFAGVLSDALDISRVRISGLGDGAALNALRLDTEFSPNEVPLPSSLLLAGIALLALAKRRRA